MSEEKVVVSSILSPC